MVRDEPLDAEPEFDPASELLAITRSLRAHLEQQLGSGAHGLPRDLDAKRRLQAEWSQAAPAAQPAPAPKAASPRPKPEEVALSARAEALGAAVPSAAAPSQAPPPASDISARPAASQPYRSLNLLQLESHVATCTACALGATRKQTVFSRGTGSSGICFVGEGPGADEDEQGEPFVGAAGQLLDRMIAAMGLGRDEVYVCNVVKCRPPNNRKPAIEEMVACKGYLERQLEILDPEVIVALGGTAVTGLLGLSEGITRLRGVFRLYDGRIPVMPTFHPAYLLRQPDAKREVWSDLRQVLARVGRSAPARG